MIRKKFFNIFGLGLLGMMITRSFPIKFLSKDNERKKKIKVEINPLAVKREKPGVKDV